AGQSVVQRRERLEHLAQTLHVVSPLATLGRGYAIVQQENGDIVRQASELKPGDRVTARVASGHLEASVTAVNSGNQ
ncbi:exodeoxyribonuclease VII large subunit, partial [Marinobacter sp.]